MGARMAGRVALVTGGGGGIGGATARLLAEEGAAVALVDRDASAVAASAADIAAAVAGAALLPLEADLTEEGGAARAVRAVLDRFGALTTLVNVAGVRVYAALADADARDWEYIIGANVLATAYCCKAALPALRGAAGASIVNVSSVYGVMGREGMAQYDTTKAAVLGLTRALAVEEARHGVRVNAVCPGSTLTSFHIRRAQSRGMSEAELRETGARNNLLGRWAEPREVAAPILFLASDEASYITGTTLMVDAGKSIL